MNASTPQAPQALDRQRSIYLDGAAGIRPRVPLAPEPLRAKAQKRLSTNAFTYLDGGAGREQSLQHNRDAFARWAIVPRMLRNVQHRDTSITLLGRPLPSPFLFAPVGVLDLAHSQAETAAARAAARLGLPFIISTQASTSMEDCTASMGTGPRWFQLYWSKSDELVISLVKRAEACDCEALVVTLDNQLLGWRTRDLSRAYLPFLRGRGIAQYVSDPVFQRFLAQPPKDMPPLPPRKLRPASLLTLMELWANYPGGIWKNLGSALPLKAVRTFIHLFSRPSLRWEELAFLRVHTRLPIFLKGILHPEDARLAMRHGADGLIVSNHGGRQVDGAIGSLDALPGVMEAVGGSMPVLFDSGVRTGSDAFKALALGAQAVCIGRPYVYGLAIDGEQGVLDVMTNLMAEFELTMALAGCASLSDIHKDMLQPRHLPPTGS